MNKVLVTGGCGYIGSHTIVDLINNGFEVISADNLVNSDTSSLNGIEEITGKSVKNYEIDLCNRVETLKIFEENPDIIGVIHFAALKSVGDSVNQPISYFHNNINSLLNVLEGIKINKVPHFIFSSSCTVYGNADELPVTESTPLKEVESPYGRTKAFAEQIIHDVYKVMDGKSILLRYFNPAGAHDSNLLGESPINPPQNLVPVITETAIGRREKMMVFGDDYDTRDGSCLRDYIHVMDLADAHTKALQFLQKNPNHQKVDVFNLGIGEGVTVLEAVKAFEKVNNLKLNYEIGPRREGDVIAIYADNSKSENLLMWKPVRKIDEIMLTSWKWELKRSSKNQ